MDIDQLISHISPLDIKVPPDYNEKVKAYFQYYDINFEDKYEGVEHYFGFLSCHRFEVVCHYYTVPEPEGSCFIVHGFYDHSGLYRHLINYCLERNLNVIIYDLPGHGLSTGERASISDFEHYQTVFQAVIGFFSRATAQPFYMVGQSTGAAIIMEYLLNNRQINFTKAVFLAPLLKPSSWWQSSMLYELCKYFIKYLPRNFSNNSSDKRFLHFIKHEDPLQPQFTDLKWVGALKKWIKRFSTHPSCHYQPLIIQGKSDTTVDWRVNIPLIEQKFPKSKVLCLEKAGHQLVNETEELRDKVFSAIDFYFDKN